MRFALTLVAFGLLGSAKIQDLVTTDDGAQTYCSTTYRQKGTAQRGYWRIFRIAEDGFQVFREFTETAFNEYYLADHPSVSGDGRVVAYDQSAMCIGGGSCFDSTYDAAYLAGSPDRYAGSGHIAISPNGRSYLVTGITPAAPTPAPTIVDLVTGKSVTVNGCNTIGDARQTLANGPIALLSCSPNNAPMLWKNGQTTPVRLPYPSPEYNVRITMNARLDANGDTIVYESSDTNNDFELHGYSVASGPDVLLAQGHVKPLIGRTFFHPWITADGTEVSYILNNQLFVQATTGGDARALTGPADGNMIDGVIAGWGGVAFAATSSGRVLQIDVATGVKTELVPPVPHIEVPFGYPAPGGLIDLTTVGPSGGDPAIEVNGVAAPMIARSGNIVTFQIPWDAAVGSTAKLVAAKNPSPLEEANDWTILAGAPNFYALPGSYNALAIHQDFSALVTDSSPALPGEIIHVYATDLGAVSPPIATGAITPTGTLYTLQTPLTCTFQLSSTQIPAQILFAALAPGTIGVDQIDIVIPAQAGGPNIGLICPSGQPIGTIPGFTQIPVARTN